MAYFQVRAVSFREGTGISKSLLFSHTVNCWFGLGVWNPRIPLWKWLLLRGTLRIANHRAPNRQLTISWLPNRLSKLGQFEDGIRHASEGCELRKRLDQWTTPYGATIVQNLGICYLVLVVEWCRQWSDVNWSSRMDLGEIDVPPLPFEYLIIWYYIVLFIVAIISRWPLPSNCDHQNYYWIPLNLHVTTATR